MSRLRLRVVLGAAAALGLFALLSGAEPRPAGTPAKPAAAADEPVRQAIKLYVAALNAGDFKTVASFWTPDGDYVDAGGRVLRARQVIENDLEQRYAGPGLPKLEVSAGTIRMVTP